MDGLSRELSYKEFIMREDYVFHAPYNPELEFYEMVRAGDVKGCEKLMSEDFCDKKGPGPCRIHFKRKAWGINSRRV